MSTSAEKFVTKIEYNKSVVAILKISKIIYNRMETSAWELQGNGLPNHVLCSSDLLIKPDTFSFTQYGYGSNFKFQKFKLNF